MSFIQVTKEEFNTYTKLSLVSVPFKERLEIKEVG